MSPQLGAETTALAAEAIDPSAWHQAAPSLMADSSGNLYAVWEDYRAGNAHIRFASHPAGGAWQASVQVDTSSTAAQVAPRIAVDGSGNLYAVWEDARGSVRAIYFAYRPAGGAWGASQVISTTTEAQGYPALAVNRRGEAVVAWQQGASPSQHVWAVLRPAGGPFGAAQRVSQAASSMPFPSAAMDDWGRAYVLWRLASSNQILFALRLAGGPWGAVESVRDSTERSTYQASLAVDRAGNAHAVWGDYREVGNANIYASYRPAGGPWSANVRVNDDYGDGAMHYDPTVTVDGAGNAIAAWGSTLTWDTFELYAAVRPRGDAWGPSVLVAGWPAAGATTGLGLAGEPDASVLPQVPDGAVSSAQSYQDPTGQTLLGEFGVGAVKVTATSGGLPIVYESATTPNPYWPHNLYVDEDGLAGIGAGGGCNPSMMGPPSGQAGAMVSPQAMALAADGDERCHAGDALEAPWLNPDFSNLPGSPLYQSGIISDLEMDGQQVYVVRAADGKDGIFTDRGDAEAFNAAHVVPEPAPALEPDPPDPPPAPPAAPILPAPTPPEEKFEIRFADDPSPPVTEKDYKRWSQQQRARELLEASTSRTLTKDELKEMGSLQSVLPASAKAVEALYKVAQQLGPDAAVAIADLMQMTPEGFKRLAAELSARIAATQRQAQQQQAAQQAQNQAPARTTRATRGQQTKTTKPKGAIETLSDYVAQIEELSKSSHPVLPHSGEFVHTETLLSIPGQGLDVQFTLNYRSQLIYNGLAGWGWEHNYDRRLVVAGGGSLALWDGAGRTGVFSFVGGQFTPSAGLYTAVVSATAGITLTDRSGSVECYFPLDASPSAGRLRSLADRNSNTLLFAYDGQGRLSTVTDTLGRPINYAYDANSRITSVTDFAGRVVQLSYDVNGDLVSVTTPAVTGTPNGNDFPAGKTTRFAYSSGFTDQRLNHNLTEIISPNEVADGSLTPSTINTYGLSGVAFDRVISQSWGGGRVNASGVPAGGTMTLAYTTTIAADAPAGAANKTTITNRGGNPLEMWYDGAGHRLRARQLVSGQWLVTDYAYNADGQVTHITYPAGNRTEYSYDEGAANALARGNLLQTRQVPDVVRGCDGLGSAPCATLVTTLTYEPTFQLVSSRTNPGGARTDYAYDGRGNLTQITYPLVTLGQAAPQVATESWTYNAFGQPLTYTDPEGTVTRYEYYATGPSAGYRQRVIEASGTLNVTTTYGYNLVGITTAVTDALGVRTNYTVNALDQLVRASAAAAAPAGQVALDYQTLYWYDANDNLIRVDVENVTPDLDADLRLTGAHSRDAANPWWTTTYVYDLLDNRVQQTAEISATLHVTTEYRYDALERLVAITNPEGNSVAYSYDERNQPRQMVTGAGTAAAMTVTYSYDDNGNWVRETDGEGHFTDYYYDGLDRQVGSVDALGNIRIADYDANGNETATRLRDGQEGRNPGRTLNAAGAVLLHATRTHYDERDRAYLEEQQYFTTNMASGVVTPITTDGNHDGWVQTAYRLDRNGRRAAKTDDGGQATTYAYDPLGRQTQRTDALNNTVAMAYDAAGNLLRAVSTELQTEGLIAAQMFTTTHSYDALNRLLQTTDNLGRTVRYSYDSRDNLVWTSDANGVPSGGSNEPGNTTVFTFDGLSRPLATTVHLRAGGVGSGAILGQVTTSIVRNHNGRVVQEIDPNGNRTTYAYDAAGRLVRLTYADNSFTTYSYDAAGSLLSYTDPNGSTVTQTFDALNRRTRSDIVRGAGVEGTTVQTFTYDGLSRLVAATDNNDPATPADDSAVSTVFDSLTNVRSETQDDRTSHSTYDGLGNRLTLAYPGGFTLTYTYDALNRLNTTTDAGGTLATYAYIGPGRVLRRTNGNGTYSTYAYDVVQQVTVVEHRRSSDNVLLSGFTYTYDRNGNRLSEVVQPGNQTMTYTYDSLNRLVGAQSATSDGQYGYDPAGNRVQTVQNGATTFYTSTTMNEYSAIGGETRTHDENGNLIRRAATGSGIAPLAGDMDADCDVDIVDIMLVASRWGTVLGDPGYDARYDLDSDDDIDIVDIMRVAVHWSSSCGPASQTQTVIHYGYDFANRLLGVTTVVTTPGASPQVVTDTVRFAYDAMGQRTSTQAVSGTVSYVYAHGQVIEERDGADVLTASYVPGLTLNRASRLWYQADALGSVRALADGTGAIVERVEYDPYGTPTCSGGGSASAYGNPYLFRGQRYDADSDLYVYGGRRYEPGAGRFLQPGSQTLGNAYTFAGNSPLAVLTLGR